MDINWSLTYVDPLNPAPFIVPSIVGVLAHLNAMLSFTRFSVDMAIGLILVPVGVICQLGTVVPRVDGYILQIV